MRAGGIVAAAAAVGLLAAGAFRTHAVYDPDAAEFGIALSTNITDWQMVVDSTFSGVARRNGKLYSTYDRSQPVGKRACPT